MNLLLLLALGAGAALAFGKRGNRGNNTDPAPNPSPNPGPGPTPPPNPGGGGNSLVGRLVYAKTILPVDTKTGKKGLPVLNGDGKRVTLAEPGGFIGKVKKAATVASIPVYFLDYPQIRLVDARFVDLR